MNNTLSVVSQNDLLIMSQLLYSSPCAFSTMPAASVVMIDLKYIFDISFMISDMNMWYWNTADLLNRIKPYSDGEGMSLRVSSFAGSCDKAQQLRFYQNGQFFPF